MTKLLEVLRDVPEVTFEPGHILIKKGKDHRPLYILKEGEVEVQRDGTPICRISYTGSAFGEISALLKIKPTATVITTKPSTFAVVEDPETLFASNAEATLEIAKLLAHRLNRLTYDYIAELDDEDSIFWSGR
ncbi:MAG: cyclic nucleotide-binding domain-containing protein [Verrucomicrobiota bacterium]